MRRRPPSFTPCSPRACRPCPDTFPAAACYGLQGRGRFYEEAGAIRDVVQNHLLQVVGFLAMEPPDLHYEEGIRDEQVRVFRKIRPLTPDCLVRGQFHGYRAEKNVAPDSTVETFAAMRLHIDSWRWEGVPFLIRAGKELPTTATEVIAWVPRWRSRSARG